MTFLCLSSMGLLSRFTCGWRYFNNIENLLIIIYSNTFCSPLCLSSPSETPLTRMLASLLLSCRSQTPCSLLVLIFFSPCFCSDNFYWFDSFFCFFQSAIKLIQHIFSFQMLFFHLQNLRFILFFIVSMSLLRSPNCLSFLINFKGDIGQNLLVTISV